MSHFAIFSSAKPSIVIEKEENFRRECTEYFDHYICQPIPYFSPFVSCLKTPEQSPRSMSPAGRRSVSPNKDREFGLSEEISESLEDFLGDKENIGVSFFNPSFNRTVRFPEERPPLSDITPTKRDHRKLQSNLKRNSTNPKPAQNVPTNASIKCLRC